jgi:hypothetical protein
MDVTCFRLETSSGYRFVIKRNDPTDWKTGPRDFADRGHFGHLHQFPG